MNIGYLLQQGVIIALTCLLISSCGGDDGGTSPQPPVTQSDITAPVISLNGESSVNLRRGEKYQELGASASDNVDGAVTVTISGEINNLVAGEYSLTYQAKDKAGNASEVTRVVTVQEFRPFITNWDTTHGGVTEDNQIKIDTQGGGFDYTVEWGDGSVDYNVKGDIVHSYSSSGTYTVSIYGDFPHFYMSEVKLSDPEDFKSEKLFESDNYKLRGIEQWGDIEWQSMHSSYRNTFIGITATDEPNLNKVVDMSHMFHDSSIRNLDAEFEVESYINLGKWDTSNVENMAYLFSGARIHELFETLVSGWENWDVSNVTNMSHMFSWIPGRVGDIGDIGNWDTSNVTDMSCMFCGIEYFSIEGLNRWNVSKVKDMSYLFASQRYGVLTGNTLANWDVSSVTNMQGMFSDGPSYPVDFSRWDVSNVTDMSYMFEDEDRLGNVNATLEDWDVSNVTNMSHMFFGSSINSDISNWNVSNVVDMSYMFYAGEFDQDLSAWDISSVSAENESKGMRYMFGNNWLSTEHYDAMLISWSQQDVDEGIEFDGGNSKYSEKSAAARQSLIDQFNWAITDGGPVQ